LQLINLLLQIEIFEVSTLCASISSDYLLYALARFVSHSIDIIYLKYYLAKKELTNNEINVKESFKLIIL
jgi:hypothetical protein